MDILSVLTDEMKNKILGCIWSTNTDVFCAVK
jgi:hypothetical protein